MPTTSTQNHPNVELICSHVESMAQMAIQEAMPPGSSSTMNNTDSTESSKQRSHDHDHDHDSKDRGIANAVLDPQNNVCTSRVVRKMIFHVTCTHVV